MGKRVATLQIAIEAQTAELKQGFQDTQKEIRTLGDGMQGAFIGAQVAATALLEVVERLFDVLSGAFTSFTAEQAVADFAETMEVSREEMQATTDAFRIMTGEMEAGQQIIQEMQVRLGEAFAEPDSTPAKAIEAIGISLADLEAMNPVARLDALSEALAQLSPDQAIFRSGEIFGGEFGEDQFVSILRFSEVYERTAANIRENGLVPLDNLREVQETFREMVIAFERVGQAIISDLLPPLKEVAQITRDLVQNWQAISGWIGDAGTWLSTVVAAPSQFAGGFAGSRASGGSITDAVAEGTAQGLGRMLDGFQAAIDTISGPTFTENRLP